MDTEVLTCCRLWDDYIGLGSLADVELTSYKIPILKSIENQTIINIKDVEAWNKMAIFVKASKRKSENPDVKLMISAIRNGKTERYYISKQGKTDMTHFENLIKDICESLKLAEESINQ